MNNIDINTVREKLVQALSKVFDDNKGLAIYGAGDTAERTILPFMESEGVFPDYFIDDTPSKQGTSFHGIPVINFEQAHEVCKSFLVALCSAIPERRDVMRQTLERKPIEGASVCAWDEYVFCQHAKEVLEVYDLLEDDLSKATYENMVQMRMDTARQDYGLVQRDHQYFGIPEFIRGWFFGEVFVDCGAYVGDTVEEYIKERAGVPEKIVAFEPNPSNYTAAAVRMERLRQEWAVPDGKMELIRAGVGEKSCFVSDQDENMGGASVFTLVKGEEVTSGGIQVVSLDDYFADQPVSFIKADIEGYEYLLVNGAKNVIQRNKPRWALCIYHSPYDMYRLALRLKELCPEYKFAVRQHSYSTNETVLYAYV